MKWIAAVLPLFLAACAAERPSAADGFESKLSGWR